MKLELLSPSRKIVASDSVKWVTLPGELGEMTIFPDHAALITNLDSGVLTYQDHEKTHFVAVHWGCASVENNEVTVLTDVAELESELDLQRAKADAEDAQSQLEKLIASSDLEEEQDQYYQRKLQKALTRQSTISFSQSVKS